MAGVTAKDVAALRQATGAGMLDCKRALEESSGDMEAAKDWLRKKGLSQSSARAGRAATQGAVAVVREGSTAAIVELRCETDFVAKAPEFVALAEELADLVAAKGEAAVADRDAQVDALRSTLKENISVGQVVRLEAGDGEVVETYLHQQSGRGVNGVAVVVRNGSPELAHDIAVHIAFARPVYLRREDVPPADVARERALVEEISRSEGKPEAALEKIVEGRMTGWFKERVLVDQPYARDDKQTVAGVLGSAEVVRYAQVVVGT